MRVQGKIAVLAGDGIGPEIIRETLGVLETVNSLFDLHLDPVLLPFGGSAIDSCGRAFPELTRRALGECHAVLLGAVGGPKYDGLKGSERPEAALLDLRRTLGVYGNYRPCYLHKPLVHASPLKPSILERGVDFVVVRELTGGIYFGERGAGCDYAYDVEGYSAYEVERVARKAFELARDRGRQFKVTSVDKANVLESSKLWRAVVDRVSLDFPEVILDHMYVDNGAMQLMRDPSQFDVILTSNLFGDILSDEASMIVGSIGLLPSASVGDGGVALYEPIHGSAVALTGLDRANPIGTILSLAMMLRMSFGLEACALAVERAVDGVLERGYRTADIGPEHGIGGEKIIGTREMGARIVEEMTMAMMMDKKTDLDKFEDPAEVLKYKNREEMPFDCLNYFGGGVLEDGGDMEKLTLKP